MESVDLEKAEIWRWATVAALCLLAVLAGAIRWIIFHRFGVDWDEAEYFDQALNNIRILRSGDFRHIGGMILIGDPSKPPAYRLLVLPFLAVFGRSIAVARFVTLILSAAAAWLVYLSTCRVSGRVGGVVAMLVFCLSIEVVLDSIFFSTEGPLYVATAGMLYFVIAGWTGEAAHNRNWIGLGLAVGVGFLAKATFAVIAIPVMAFVLFDAYRERRAVLDVVPLFKASAVAFLVAAPWWVLNFSHVVAYATFAGAQGRQSLGTPSLSTWAKLFGTIFVSLLGPGVSILLIFILVVALWRGKHLNLGPDGLASVRRKVQIACVCAGLPLLLAQMASTNHNLRYLTPTVIPLGIVFGTLVESAGLVGWRLFFTLFSLLMPAQAAMLVFPVLFPNRAPVSNGLTNGTLPWRVMARSEQWDWSQLYEISLNCGLKTPKISYLGNGREFGPPQLEYPWFANNAFPPEVTRLWQYEEGPIEWQRVMEIANTSDIVLTVPNYIGERSDKQDLDNQFDTEFANRLSGDSLFRDPVRISADRFERVTVLVFVKKELPCRVLETVSIPKE